MGILSDWIDKITDPENIPHELEALDLIVTGLEMFEIGGAAVEVLGIATPVLAWGAGVYELFVGLRNETKKEVKQKAFARGYAIGVVASVVGVSGRFVKMHYWLNSPATGMNGDVELATIAMKAHNGGLAVGYQQAQTLDEARKKKLRTILITLHHKQLEAEGRNFVDPGNDEERILMWAGAFRRAMLE
jgi:hypothetical protein